MSQTLIDGENPTALIANIALPIDVDANRYIALCFKTGTVSIRCQDGSFYNRVPISDSDLQEIEFPTSYKKLGSPVVCVNEPIKNQLFIVSTLHWPQALPDLKYGQFKIRKKYNDGYVEVSGSAKEGNLSLIVNTVDKGVININLISKNNNGEYNLDVQGDITVTASNRIVMRSNDSINLSTSSEKESAKLTQTSTQNHFEGNSFKINKGEQPMVLGNSMNEFLSELITTISSATVIVDGSPTPLVNAVQISQLSSNLPSLLSKIGSLD